MQINNRRHFRVLLTIVLTASAGNALAAWDGDWLVRGRLINVNPDTSSGDISTIPGANVNVNNDTTLEVDFTYMATRNIGLELILATTKHTVLGEGGLAGTKVAETGVLPPTMTLQYHFMPHYKTRPYAGVGVNYTLFYDKKSALSGTSIDFDNSFGLSAQAGVDIDMDRGWLMNADVKYIDINTTATLAGGVNGTVDVDINPWVFGVGVGKTF